MKKVLFIAIVFVAGLTSCKKDYTCDCSGSDSLAAIEYDLGKVKKSDAEESCDAFDATFSLVGGSCELKD